MLHKLSCLFQWQIKHFNAVLTKKPLKLLCLILLCCKHLVFKLVVDKNLTHELTRAWGPMKQTVWLKHALVTYLQFCLLFWCCDRDTTPVSRQDNAGEWGTCININTVYWKLYVMYCSHLQIMYTCIFCRRYSDWFWKQYIYIFNHILDAKPFTVRCEYL